MSRRFCYLLVGFALALHNGDEALIASRLLRFSRMAEADEHRRLSGSVGPDKRGALETLRRTMHTIVPGVEECISYGMPAFRLDRKVVAGWRPSPRTSRPTSKRNPCFIFEPARPLPVALVKKRLNARVVEVRVRGH